MQELQSYTTEPEPDGIVDLAIVPLPRPDLTKHKPAFREVAETLLLATAIYCLVNLSSARFVIEGPSMSPNFASRMG